MGCEMAFHAGLNGIWSCERAPTCPPALSALSGIELEFY